MGSAVVCLLRGVNVGGRSKLPMATLREVAADLGLTGATTYVQSGNLVVPDPPAGVDVGAVLAEGLEGVGLSTTVLTRTAGELAAAVAANPFSEEAADGATVHVAFLPGSIGDALADVDPARFAPDEVAVVNGQRSTEVYLSLPGGIGRSKLAAALARRSLAGATVRNWNTVLALHDLAGG